VQKKLRLIVMAIITQDMLTYTIFTENLLTLILTAIFYGREADWIWHI